MLPWKKRRARAYVAAADRARDARDWQSARTAYRAALAEQPNDAAVWVQAGHVAKESGDLEEARMAYTRAELLEPTNIDIQIQLGHFHKLIGEDNLALRHYTKAISSGSSDEHALHFVASTRNEPGGPGLLEQADALRDMGAFQQASSLYREAALNDPNGSVFVQLGNCLKECGTFDAAEAAYLAALKLNDADADCLLQLGHLMKISGKLSLAKEYYMKSAELDPNRPDATTEIERLAIFENGNPQSGETESGWLGSQVFRPSGETSILRAANGTAVLLERLTRALERRAS